MPFYRASIETCVFPDLTKSVWAAIPTPYLPSAIALFESELRVRSFDYKFPRWGEFLVKETDGPKAVGEVDKRRLKVDLATVLTLGTGEMVHLDAPSSDIWVPTGTNGHLSKRAVQIEDKDSNRRLYPIKHTVLLGGVTYSLEGYLGASVSLFLVDGLP